ncbi:MAG: hypothetical protein K2M06_03115 [Muribaculaceae bacterium]|nr:hypothetical protein [Muribaculaceae bacterium]
MKKTTFAVLTLLCLAAAMQLSSCAGDSSSSAMKAAAEAGRRDALDVMALDSAGMGREGGILAIRTRETELRAQGLDSCANAYARGAYAVIDSVLSAENALR